MASLSLTVHEASYVAGVTVRGINHEIDEKIITPAAPGGARKVLGADLLYLAAVKNVRTGMGRLLRQRFRTAILAAALSGQDEAMVECFSVSLGRVEAELLPALQRLQDIETKGIESLPAVLAGEPVIKGTRIAARHVAELIRRGTSVTEVAEELDLTPDQVETALIFDRVTPRLGRPSTRKVRVVDVPAC